MPSRFNFKELLRNIRADILDIKDNFDKIEEKGALLTDLPDLTPLLPKSAISIVEGNISLDGYQRLDGEYVYEGHTTITPPSGITRDNISILSFYFKIGVISPRTRS